MENSKPLAYYKRTVFNSLKNEYRQNDNAAKHIRPAGAKLELMSTMKCPEGEIDCLISIHDVQSWLMFIDNPRLYFALTELNEKDRELLFLMFVEKMNQAEAADLMGVSQCVISRRWKRLKKFFLKKL